MREGERERERERECVCESVSVSECECECECECAYECVCVRERPRSLPHRPFISVIVFDIGLVQQHDVNIYFDRFFGRICYADAHAETLRARNLLRDETRTANREA